MEHAWDQRREGLCACPPPLLASHSQKAFKSCEHRMLVDAQSKGVYRDSNFLDSIVSVECTRMEK